MTGRSRRHPASIAATLVRLRHERQLSQAALAKASGLGQGTIARLEGVSPNPPTTPTLQALAAGLAVDPSVFGLAASSAALPKMKRAPPPPGNLGPLLQRLRIRRALTQQQLADLADVSRSTIDRIERGNGASTTTATIEALARALQIPPSDFWSQAPDVAPAPLLSSGGPLLRRLRTERHLTQRQLADLAGLGYATIQRLERGGGAPTTPATLKALARALQVSSSTFELEDPSHKRPSTHPSAPRATGRLLSADELLVEDGVDLSPRQHRILSALRPVVDPKGVPLSEWIACLRRLEAALLPPSP